VWICAADAVTVDDMNECSQAGDEERHQCRVQHSPAHLPLPPRRSATLRPHACVAHSPHACTAKRQQAACTHITATCSRGSSLPPPSLTHPTTSIHRSAPRPSPQQKAAHMRLQTGGSDDDGSKTLEFPELVGVDAEEARGKILEKHPELKVQVRVTSFMHACWGWELHSAQRGLQLLD